MKILFNCPVPFNLAHGGAQVQIARTMSALDEIGVAVEPLRWWDEKQTGDVLHYFSRIPISLLKGAQRKGLKVVFSDLLTGQGSRSRMQLRIQKLASRLLERSLPRLATQSFNWESFRLADACIALTEWEAHLMSYTFGAPPEKLHVVPNGVEDVFLNSKPAARGKWLVCTATITERKRVLELAEAAVRAKTPLWVLGKPYADTAPYAQRFLALAREHPQVIRYEGAVSDRAQLARIYREARGFVLMSTMESLSLSALEAAACECPLLLSDLHWARTTLKETASYCPIAGAGRTAPFLRRFYDAAPNLKSPPRPETWTDVARQLKAIYESLAGTSSQLSVREA
jgi:glycosyltransferase involved in cell wall biosynthesis